MATTFKKLPMAVPNMKAKMMRMGVIVNIKPSSPLAGEEMEVRGIVKPALFSQIPPPNSVQYLNSKIAGFGSPGSLINLRAADLVSVVACGAHRLFQEQVSFLGNRSLQHIDPVEPDDEIYNREIADHAILTTP